MNGYYRYKVEDKLEEEEVGGEETREIGKVSYTGVKYWEEEEKRVKEILEEMVCGLRSMEWWRVDVNVSGKDVVEGGANKSFDLNPSAAGPLGESVVDNFTF
eukprot:TRINITY_DN4070_c0_g1_i1.p1 TRINITY_DN4070_c0_g1~~TRINITY_DN4070_c0_g1_i1.p1  ORF type:complete len:102 (-),score=43.86 TRINITY_DN4070_c0_g1_i1:483-788(-)